MPNLFFQCFQVDNIMTYTDKIYKHNIHILISARGVGGEDATKNGKLPMAALYLRFSVKK